MTDAIAHATFLAVRKLHATDAAALESAARILDRTPEGLAAQLGLDRPRRRGGPRKGEPNFRPRGPGKHRPSRCWRGHSLTDAIVRANGTRACRLCHRERVRKNEKKRVRCRARRAS